MLKVKNTHTARVAGVAPGQTGDVDESHPAVRLQLAAGLLVPVGSMDSVDMSAETVTITTKELAEMAETARDIKQANVEGAAELARITDKVLAQSARIGELESINASQSARIVELEAELAKKPAKPAKTESEKS